VSPDGGKGRALPAETRAFINVAQRFTHPAPALFLLAEEMETLPDRDPLLPVLDFALFAEGLEGPATAGPRRPEVETSRRSPVVPWPAMSQSARTVLSNAMGRETDRSPSRDEPVGRERATLSPPDHETTRVPHRHMPAPGRGDGRNTAIAQALAAVLAAGAYEPVAEETHRGATTPRGDGRNSLERDAPLASGAPWTGEPHTPGVSPEWSWLATNEGTVEPSAPTSVAGWEALSLVDNLANDLISQRPITLLTPAHPATRSSDYEITPSSHHQAPEIRASRAPGTPDPIAADEVEGEEAAPLEPDDVAAMVAAVLYEQARRHGVDLS
jgi:hypothetical protein